METQVVTSATAQNDRLVGLIDKYLTKNRAERQKRILAEINPVVWKRILALKKLCYDTIKTESEFHMKVFQLEREYLSKYNSIMAKRSEVLTSNVIPPDEECKFPGSEEIAETPSIGNDSSISEGIPNFWLNVMQNDREVEQLIQKEDEEVLKHLSDIRINIKDDLSFQLEFHFKPNDYFENSVLTKTYHIKCEPDELYPFSFDGPEIFKATGCEIKWKEGKNLTLKTEDRPKSALKFFETPTFFNFFNPPTVSPGDSDEHEQVEVYLESDFEIGHHMKERIVPRAVLFFLGEVEYDEFSLSDYGAADDSNTDDESETFESA